MLSTQSRCGFCGRRCDGNYCDAECKAGVEMFPAYWRDREMRPTRGAAPNGNSSKLKRDSVEELFRDNHLVLTDIAKNTSAISRKTLSE
jgi:hypothetical protein